MECVKGFCYSVHHRQGQLEHLGKDIVKVCLNLHMLTIINFQNRIQYDL